MGAGAVVEEGKAHFEEELGTKRNTW